MGKIVSRNNPCPDPECGSSDAFQIYEEGDGFCFSCQKRFPAGASRHVPAAPRVPSLSPPQSHFKAILTPAEIAELPIRGFKERGITKAVCEFFGVKCEYGSNGEISAHLYPYGETYKRRELPKSFTWTNGPGDIFGIDLFAGGGKRLLIVEGELDALSIAQAHLDKYDKIYPVISIPSAAVVNNLLKHREWIRSFDEVVLCMDNDEPGIIARDAALKIVGFDKARLVNHPKDCKDASDILVKLGWQPLMHAIWDATPWSPAGIIRRDALWEALATYNAQVSVPYPACLQGLNTKLKGMRAGEIALFISGTGLGKSTILREIMLELHAVTDSNIGVVSLEESPAETTRKLAGMALNRNPANEEIPLDELRVGFDKVFGDDRFIVLDHQGSIKDSSIVDQLEYMALSGCKYLFIDHITILVSEGAENLVGNEAIDKVMNDLLRLAKRYNVWIGLVSHLRKAPSGGKSFEEGHLPTIDDIRGSGSIKQISFDIVSFARNSIAQNDTERNTITMRVLKSRYTGLTGDVPGAYYNNLTGRFTGLDKIPQDAFHAL